jgi:hypothetical protein
VIIHSAPASFDRELRVTTEGAYRFYAGLRSDPSFIDSEGFRHSLQFTGHDVLLEANVFGIVLEAPNRALGSNRSIGIWARTMAPVQGLLHQMDEMARPANFFNRYDATSAAGYPNRRKFADDIVDSGLSLMTQGRITTDLVEPHTDYLAEFPYLGLPHGG